MEIKQKWTANLQKEHEISILSHNMQVEIHIIYKWNVESLPNPGKIVGSTEYGFVKLVNNQSCQIVHFIMGSTGKAVGGKNGLHTACSEGHIVIHHDKTCNKCTKFKCLLL